jgi:hypothetical protein
MKTDNIKLNRIIFTSVIAAVFLFVFSGTASASTITPEKVVDMVNKDRIKEGLSALVMNKLLSQAAEYKAEDMLKKDYFAHTSPEGMTPWHWIEKSGYNYKYAGENLAVGFESAEKQQSAWMKSETHRKNILNTSYRDIGVAVKEGKINGENTLLTVQIFGATALVPAVKKDVPVVEPVSEPAVLPAEISNPEVPKIEDVLEQKQPVFKLEKDVKFFQTQPSKLSKAIEYLKGLGNKFAQGDLGFYTMAVALAGVGYLTVLNVIILLFLVIQLKRKNLPGEKYQVLYTVSAEEYEDLVRGFKARARGIYKASFGKIHLKIPG